MSLIPNFGGLVESGNGGGGGSKKQIFPARVKNIILQPSTDPNSLFVKNNGYTRVLACCSVDGLDILNGK